MLFKINFVHQKKEITVSGGSLADACAAAGFPLNLVCGGRGNCKKCGVTVRRNGKMEKVLACKTMIERDEEVYLDESDYKKVNVLTESYAEKNENNPAVKKKYWNKRELFPEHGKGFLKNTSVEIMRKFSDIVSKIECKGCTFVYFGNRVIDIQEEDTTEKCYGAAIDIGTTTVVVYLYDLAHNCLIATKSGLNKQVIHGADVITRITFSQERRENLNEMRDLILETVNEMLYEIEKENQHICENLYHIVLCGNSTMQHLFFGWNPANLGSSPFVNITTQSVFCRGNESGLQCAKGAVVEFLPLLGGFVGADTTSVLLTLSENISKKYLIVDLGTNGEIAVGNYNRFLVASTACGPALEGGNISCGMRGTEGAIEKIFLSDDKIELKVIGDIEPIGICGSAIIDAIAELRRIGIIDDMGVLLSAEEYEKKCPGSVLSKKIKEIEKYNRAFFFIEGDKPVYISQKDIRQIQMAKSSIYTGCMTLLKEYGIKVEDIDVLILSGAFGNYIDVGNALYIGLLPSVEKNKIISVGNGAGQGVQSILLDDSFREKLKLIPEKTVHVELASHPDFMDGYIENMNF